MTTLTPERLKALIAKGRVQLGARAASNRMCAVSGCPVRLDHHFANAAGRDLFILHPAGHQRVFAGAVCPSCAIEIRTRMQDGGAPVADRAPDYIVTVRVRQGQVRRRLVPITDYQGVAP